MDDTINNLSLTNIFTQPPMVYFKTTKVLCPECQTKLKVYYTDKRKVYSLHIGVFKAHRTFMYCQDCNTVYPAEEFGKIAPVYSNVGYDVIVFIGRLIFHEHHTLKETISVLESRNIHISSSEVAYLAQKFIIYLSILHQESGLRLKMQIQQKGGYILHVDGTSEGASPHLISAIDEVSNFVLANVKVPSESKEQILPFLKEIKEQYGDPLALTSDMGRAFLSAISEVFPDKPNYICHFHFLRDIGKDLLEKEYSIIRNKLKKYGITSQLRYRLRYYFDNKTEDINVTQINEIIETTKHPPVGRKDSRIIKQVCNILLLWALDGKNHGNGFGFPLDRPHGEFYKRLCLLFQKLKSFKKKCSVDKSLSKIIAKIIDDLMPLVNDIECRETFQILTEKEKVFDKLRQALSIALPSTTDGLNDNGEDVEIDTIENKVKDFNQWALREKYYHKNNDYQKLICQIEKYWDMLFSDPIIISSPDGDSFIQPQRTNNILEQFFRGIRRAHRRTTGNNSMCKKLQSMFADTPLVKNLDNPDYMKVILNGGNSLEEKFAEIDHKKVIAKMKDARKVESKIPRKIKKFIRNDDSMSKLLYLIAN
ncbi:MAG: transposase [Bacteroidetes bacterium]|nr:transposase [Bacteroidota bacterium]